MIRYLLSLLTFAHFVCATHYAPWYESDLLPELSVKYTFGTYPEVASGSRTVNLHSDDHFVDFGAYLSILNAFTAEVEVGTAATDRHSYNLNDVRLTGRYLLLDDVQGDPVSLSIGITGTYASTPFVDDISVFHHGEWELEGHIAVGKEAPCYLSWDTHFWGLLGMGIADRGSPWLHGELWYQKNHCNRYHYGLFLKGLFGFGDSNLRFDRPFHGYGPIQHRSLDLGGQFAYDLCDYGTLILEYSYRLWAHNFPARAQYASLRFTYPFPL